MMPQPFADIHPALFAMLAVGALLSMVATIWFLIVGFQEHVLWGLGMLFCGFVHFAFLIVHFKKAWMPTLLALLALVVMGIPTVVIVAKLVDAQIEAEAQAHPGWQAAPPPVGRPDPFEVPAPDEAPAPTKAITLTGADREDYTKLARSKKWTAIEWANADVTDDDLEVLHGMAELRELDLSGTQVTDDGLHAIEGCDKLEVLKLARTAVTEEGFREHVLPIETLMTLDLRGTKVPKKLGREWEKAVAGRKVTQ